MTFCKTSMPKSLRSARRGSRTSKSRRCHRTSLASRKWTRSTKTCLRNWKSKSKRMVLMSRWCMPTSMARQCWRASMSSWSGIEITRRKSAQPRNETRASSWACLRGCTKIRITVRCKPVPKGRTERSAMRRTNTPRKIPRIGPFWWKANPRMNWNYQILIWIP